MQARRSFITSSIITINTIFSIPITIIHVGIAVTMFDGSRLIIPRVKQQTDLVRSEPEDGVL